MTDDAAENRDQLDVGKFCTKFYSPIEDAAMIKKRELDAQKEKVAKKAAAAAKAKAKVDSEAKKVSHTMAEFRVCREALVVPATMTRGVA